MSAPAPTTIICGVTCACAQEKKAEARPDASCVAQADCAYAKNGECACKDGVCISSQNKQKCSLALNGGCDCAAGTCKKMAAVRKECSANPGCDCEAGECKKASLPIS